MSVEIFHKRPGWKGVYLIKLSELHREAEITIACPKCDFQILVKPEALDQDVFYLKCPACQHSFGVEKD